MKNLFTILLCCIAFIHGCGDPVDSTPTSQSGVKKATTTVRTDLNGKTIEQNNIINRLQEDNKPGSIKHLYIISAYSGQVILYSTVKGKVTSSGKRISPTTLAMTGSNYNYTYNPDLIQDDGSYGSSIDYVYWWDSKGIYHQQYVTGGMILHISNEPIAVKSITLNLELSKTE